VHDARPGETWAYRAPKSKELERAEVIDLSGKGSTHRAFIEPLHEWVPIGRLKSRWDERDVFLLREARLSAIYDAGIGYSDPAYFAIDIVYDEVVPREFAEACWGRQASASRIYDRPGFAAFLGVDESMFDEDTLAFEDDGAYIVSWPMTERILKLVCGRHAPEMERAIRKFEGDRVRRAVEGERSADGRWYSPEVYNSVDAEYAASYDVVRRWIKGSASPLEIEVARLGAQVEELIEMMSQGNPPDGRGRTK
jgi:hypothetical protein